MSLSISAASAPVAPLVLDKNTPVHFVGVGGIGMSGLAKLLQEKGFQVSGSDIAENAQTKLLQSLGAKIFKGHSDTNVPAGAILVVSSSIDPQNPEINVALERGQAIYHRSDLLKEILQGKAFAHAAVVGISGTHGKTTITGMTGVALEAAALSPTVVVGGNVPEWNTNAKLGEVQADGKCRIAVAELDESDGTIIKYTPQVTVISNLELDHADHYQEGLKAIRETFTKYLNALDETSTVIFYLDCPETLELAKIAPKHLKKVFYTGRDFSANPDEFASLFDTLDAKAIYWLKNSRHHGLGSYQGYAYRQEKKRSLLLGEIHLTVPGQHNLYNALSAIAVGDQLGADFEPMTAALRQFSGMGRRFEKIGELKSGQGIIKLVDDYAHHPTEVRATLSAAKESVKATGGKVLAVFQPHRYTRLKALWEEFCTCFDDADQVIITDVYAASEQPLEGVDAETFAKNVRHPNVCYLPLEAGKFTQIRQFMQENAKPGDIVLSMGAGNITQAFRNWQA